MNKDRREELYNNLINSGKVDSEQIGSLDEFRTTIKDEPTARQFYRNLLGAGFGEDEIGNEDDFYGSIKSDFAKVDDGLNGPNVAMPAPTEEEKRSQYLSGQKSLQEMVDERKASSDGTKFVMPEGWSVDTSTNHGNTSWQTVGKSAKGLKEMRDNGQLDVLYNSEEEQRIDQQYKPRKVETVSDIQSNYADRFAMTERGKALGDELQKVEVSVTEKYYNDYAKTDEYKTLLAQARKQAQKAKTQEEIDAINRQFNEDVSARISALYGGKMEADVAPYRQAYNEAFLNRYGNQMEADAYQLNKDKSADELQVLSDKVNGLLNAEEAARKEKQDRIARERRLSGARDNAMNAMMGSWQTQQARAEESEKTRDLRVAQRQLEQAQEVLDAARGAGFWTALGTTFDWSKWDGGATDLADASRINRALQKSEKGEALTEDEQTLLDAALMNMTIQGYYGSDAGTLYNMGKVTAESLPFMFNMIINPISGTGNALAKGMLKYGLKKFGKYATKGVERALRITSNAISHGVIVPAGMTATTSAGNVAAGTMERLNQNYDIKQDGDGRVIVVRNGENASVGEAALREFGTTFIGNQSEMIFKAFPMAGKALETMGKTVFGGPAEVIARAIPKKVKKLYTDVHSNPYMRGVKKRAHIGGIGEEYMEEVYDNFANVGIGEMNMEDALSVKQNVETFLGLIPTQLVFSTIGVGGYVRERRRVSKDLTRYRAMLTEDVQREVEAAVESARGDENGLTDYFMEVIGDASLTPEQRKARMKYAAALQERDTLDEIEEAKQEEEQTPQEAAMEAGVQAETPEEKHAISRNYEAMMEWKSLLDDEDGQFGSILDMEDRDAAVAALDEQGYGERMREAFNYWSAVDAYEGMAIGANDRVNEAVYDANWDASRRAHVDGRIIEVMTGDNRSLWVKSGNLVWNEDGTVNVALSDPQLIVVSESGKVEMISPRHIMAAAEKTPLAEQKKYNNTVLREQLEKQEADEVELNPNTPPVAPGLTYTDEQGNQMVVTVVAGGQAQVAPVGEAGKEGVKYSYVPVDELRGMISRQLDIKEGANVPLQPDVPSDETGDIKTSEETVKNDGASTGETQQNVSEQVQTAIERVPKDEQGNLLYEEADADTAWDAIVEEAEGDEAVAQEAVADIVSEAEKGLKDAEKALKKAQEAKPEVKGAAPTMAERIAAKKQAKANTEAAQKVVDDAKARLDKWKAIAGTVERRNAAMEAENKRQAEEAARQERERMEAEEVARRNAEEADRLMAEEPQNGRERAAQAIGTGEVMLLIDSYKRETGYGDKEVKSMFGTFAGKEKGGKTIEEAAEYLVAQDAQGFFGDDVQEARNAILDVLQGVRKKSELRNYIANQRKAAADEMARAEREAYEEWTMGAYGMTPEEYESYVQMLESENPFGNLSEEDYHAIFAEARESYYNYINSLENEQRRTDGITEGSNKVLSDEQTDNSGGNGEVPEGGQEQGIGDRVAGADAASQKEAGEIKPVGRGAFGNIYDQFRGKAKEAIRFLLGRREGEAVGALHHPEIGEISLVWGNKKAGLEKIASKHSEVIDNLQEIIDGMRVVSKSDNRIKLESGTHFAVVSREYMGQLRDQWLLTAYEKKETPKPTNSRMDVDSNLFGMSDDTATRQDLSASSGNSVSDNTIDTGETSTGGKRNDTATPQNTVSEGKGSESSGNEQGIEGIKSELGVFGRDNAAENGVNESSRTREVAPSDVMGRIEALAQDYERQREEKRRKPLRERVRQWERALGVKVYIVERLDDVTDRDARRAIERGRMIAGWRTANGEVAVYMPFNASVKEIDKTVLHELVGHDGLRGLLGKEGFDALCDKVWDMMPKNARARYYNYLGVKDIEDKTERRRAAADEYMANLAEREKLLPQQKNLWNRIVDAIMELFGKRLGKDEILAKDNLKKGDIAELLRLSYRRMESREGENEVEEDSSTRFRFIGEKGAANLDKFEEATTRLDNLAVARDMESANKDVRTIKMATGWERGADGKWRYEVEDAKLKDTITIEGKAFKRNESDMLWTSGLLEDTLDAPGLFEAYPELGDVRLETDTMTGDLPSNGAYDHKKRKITIHANELKYLNSILNHEIQHAIQHIEGFAQGGNNSFANKKIEEVKELLGISGNVSINDLVTYLENGYQTPQQDKAVTKLANEAGYENAVDYVRSLNPYSYYRRLSGEVEARNVESRLAMRAEERRASLAAETEDVAREDQIFLYDGVEIAEMGSRVDRRMSEIGIYFEGRELTANQQAIVDVFSGAGNNLSVTVKKEDDSLNRVVMRQGREDKAGSKHSILRHFGTSVGSYTAEEILIIEDVLANGERTESVRRDADTFEYNLSVNGVVYTVITEKNNRGAEIFADFYTNRSDNARSLNTQLSAQADSTTASGGKGTNKNSNEQETRFRFVDGMTNDEIYDGLNELSGYSNGAYNLMNALEEYYGGRIVSASSGARHAIEKGFVPVPKGQYEVANEEYHHLEFEGENGETFVKAVPFVEAEGVEENEGIRFREVNSLVGLHNLSVDKLKRALKNGGLANPSAAIIDILKQTHTMYGDVTLVMPNSLVAAKSGRHKGVWGADIYSPNYPQVYTRLSDKNQEKLSKWIYDNSGENGKNLSMSYTFLNSVERGSLEGLEYIFLKERGVDMTEIDDYVRDDYDIFWREYFKKYDNDAAFVTDWAKNEEMRKAISMHIVNENAKEIKRAILRSMIDKKKAEGVSDEQIKKDKLKMSFDAYNEAKREIESLMLGKDGSADLGIVMNEFQKNYRAYRNRGKFDERDTLWNVSNYMRENNLRDEYNEWAQGIIDQYEPKEVLYNGTDYMGRPKYIANTLENASRIMKAQGLNAGDSLFETSMGGARAQLTPVMKTLDSIRKNKWRLDEQAFEQAKKELEQEYTELAGLFSKDNDYSFDEKYFNLIDAMKSGNAFDWATRNGFDISEEDGKRIDDYAKALRDMPTAYFELKFERPVGLNEFVAAVVPNNTPYPILDELEREGLTVYTYDANKEGDREVVTKEATKGEGIRFREANENQAIFVSNAEKAVKGIKQEKATPQQWLAMIEKNGGLKAGEDKWLGLSDWLKASEAKTITKEEILDFIGENKIVIEEVKYGEGLSEFSNERLDALNDEFQELISEGEEVTDSYYTSDWVDYAWNAMVDRYGDDFESAFEIGGSGTNSALVPTLDYNDEISSAARYFLGIEDSTEKPINSTRLGYTTEGLENKREIALTVPTIESWNESDEIHFGDAGEGRAVAWVRFGETFTYENEDYVREVTEFKEPYKDVNGHDIYKTDSGSDNDFVIYGKGRNGDMIYVVAVNGEQIPVAHKSLDDAKNGMNKYFKEHPVRNRKRRSVLVIDEIQSKRHQEGREHGYDTNEYKNYTIGEYRSGEESDIADILSSNGSVIGHVMRSNGAYWAESVDGSHMTSDRSSQEEAANALLNTFKTGIPAAPFEKNWHELAMKRMLRLAAEEGFDKVAWTTGAQQAERYDLSKQVSSIEYARLDNGHYKVTAYGRNGYPIDGIPVVYNNEQEIADTFGKEIAVKITQGVERAERAIEDHTKAKKELREKMNGVDKDSAEYESMLEEDDLHDSIIDGARRSQTIDGDNLSIGGEGMKGFYDKMLPSFVQKYVKKWGAKVGEVELPELEESARKMWSVDVTPEMKESVMEGQTMFREITDPLIQKAVDTFAKRYNAAPVEELPSDREEMIAFAMEEGYSREEAEDLYNKFRNTKSSYISVDDKIYIFAGRVSEDEVEEALIHENVHRAISQLMSEEELQVLADALYKLNPKLGEKIRKSPDYKEEDFNEEMIAYSLQLGHRNGMQKYLGELAENEQIKNILNFIDYDGRRKNSIASETGTENAVLAETGNTGTSDSRRKNGRRNRRVDTRQAGVAQSDDGRYPGRENLILDEIVRLEEELGTSVNAIDSFDALPEGRAKDAIAEGRKVLGWYQDGRVYVYMPNARSAGDVRATVYHEVVGHLGLREMLGDRFNAFLDRVYMNLPADVRADLNGRALRNNWDFREATEEYMAELAERFVRGEKVSGLRKVLYALRDAVVKALHSLGIDLGFEMSDNYLMYVLWASKQNLKPSDVMGRIANVAMRYLLNVDGDVVRPTPPTRPTGTDGMDWADGRVAFREVTDKDTLDFLNGQETMKAYRAMQVIDGKLYPPMSAKVEGKLREPIELGKWEEAEERPDLADERGYFKLDKANKSSLKARYNPYIHTSLTPLNDQFSSAQERPNLVTVEVEIPVSELTSGYKADKAKDAVGKVEWKAGVVQSQLTGTRTVILSRWDKPMRIVPESEVADRIVGMFGDKKVVMPSNVVTPQLRAELEKRGVPFVETDNQGKRIKDDGLRFREVDPEDDATRMTREAYEKNLKSLGYRMREAFQDEMLSLKIAQEIVEKKAGRKLKSYENAYMAENHLSSINKTERDKFIEGDYEKMMDFIDEWIDDKKETPESINAYVFAKSGLERNREFAVRDALAKRLADEELTEEEAKRVYEAYKNERDELRQSLKAGRVSYEEFNRLSDNAAKRHAIVDSIGDYSGLQTLTGDKKGFRDKSEKIVLEFEKRHEKKDSDSIREYEKFWEAVRTCTRAAVKKQYDSGMILKSQYDHVTQMFEWYIPLRGFNEKTAEDVYDYVGEDTGTSIFSPTLKKAEGRKSLPDDPFANIANMMQSAILQGNRNKMKQHFLNMVQNTPTELFTVADAWLVKTLVKDEETGRTEERWVDDYAVITENMTPEEAEKAILANEESMKELEKQGKAMRKKAGLNIDYKMANPKNVNQHVVVVKRGGKEFVIYVNGNPRVAQALNGMLKDTAENFFVKMWDKWTRFYSATRTSYNIDFVLANLARDWQHAFWMTAIQNGGKDALSFAVNSLDVVPALLRGVNGRSGKSSKQYDRYFEEFLKNGGETGYSHITSVEEWKEINNKRMKRLKGMAKAAQAGKNVLPYMESAFSYLNRIAEDLTRFNVYVLNRKKGEDIATSIQRAKDITVNFNKKGSGRTNGFLGGAANIFRRWMPFANPIVQGITQFLRVSKEHKVRMGSILSGHMAAGFLVPFLNAYLVDVLGGDDDDDYMNQSDYSRRNNLMIYTGGGYIKLPLPPMFREVYGLGDVLYCAVKGYLKPGKAALETVNMIRNMFSLGGQSSLEDADFSMVRFILPTQVGMFVDIAENVNFMGAPIYKETPWDEYVPEHKKVYKGTWSGLVWVSAKLNELMSNEYADPDTEAAPESTMWMNPAVWQHLINELFGGPVRTLGNVGGLIMDVASGELEENFTWSTVPVGNRFYTTPTDRTKNAATNRRYYDVKEYYDRLDRRSTQFEKRAENGDVVAAELLSKFRESDDYKWYMMLKNDMDEIEKESRKKKKAADPTAVDKKITELKKKVVDKVYRRKDDDE